MDAMAENVQAGSPVTGSVGCCDEFRRAVEISFANYRDDETGWFLFGTDHESAIAGEPEIAYWIIRFCPFCGAPLGSSGVQRSAPT